LRDTPYTPEIIQECLEAWPQLESALNSGKFTLKIKPEKRLTLEQRLAAKDLAASIKAPRQRTEFTIDVPVIMADISNAMTAVLDKDMIWLVTQHHYYGYTEEEVAEIVGVTQQAVNYRLKRAYSLMSEWLERPAVEKVSALPPRDNDTHRRSYIAIP
jgi:ParB-like chromosome segregation protein Spo0J